MRSTRRAGVLLVLVSCLSLAAGASAYGEAPDHAEGQPAAAAGDGFATPFLTPSPTPPVQAATEASDPVSSDDPTVDGSTVTPAESPAPVEDAEVEAEEDGEVRANAPGDIQRLRLEATTSEPLVQVGNAVDHTIEAFNPGPGVLTEVLIEADVPPELAVLDTSGTGGQGTVSWVVPSIQPGETVVLDIRARVAEEGDLHAQTTFSAESAVDAVEADTATVDTYIAARRGKTVSNPDPEIYKRVSFKRPEQVVVRVDPPVTAAARAAAARAAADPSILPRTGLPVGVFLSLGGLLIALGGLVLLAQIGLRRPGAVVGLLVLALGLGACTQDVTGPQADRAASPSPETPDPTDASADDEPEDEVKGTVIRPDEDDGDADGTSAAGGSDEGSEGDTGSTDGDAVAPEAPTTTTITVYEEVVRNELVPVEEIPVRALGSTPGDNQMSMSWNGDGIDSAASSLSFQPGAPVELLTSLTERGGAVIAQVTLRNLLEGERVALSGRFLHQVDGSGGFHGTMTSERVDVVLNPGGTTTYRFTYDLPAGSFALGSRFESN